MDKEKNNFEELYSIDVNSRTEKKGNLTYLSWAWAWAEIKKRYPTATYKIKRFGENKLPYVYDKNTGYMVFTEVKIDELTHEMWLPVMDFRNKAMIENATMFEINKTIMRCLTKNLAMFGLGLYIYAGEDMPEVSDEEKAKQTEENREKEEQVKKEWQDIKTMCNELSDEPMKNRDMMLAFIGLETDSKDPSEIKKVLSNLIDKKNA